MKAQDIVDRLSSTIPLYTNTFSNSMGISALSISGLVVTITTSSPHGLVTNQNVSVLGIEAPVQIDTINSLRTGTTLSIVTLQDHDFTLSLRDKASGIAKLLTVSGAPESELNGTFQIIGVPNRRAVLVSVSDAGATTYTSTPLIENANGGIYNGLFPATNLTSTTFDYTLSQAYALPGIFGAASVQVSLRILSVLDIEQYLLDIYTAKPIGESLLVVQLGDVQQSKKRDEQTDAASSSAGQNSYSPIVLQPFAIYIIQNATQSLTAASLRDTVESDLIPAIFKSLLKARFNTGFTYSQFRTTFTGHGVYAYASAKNKSMYVHEVTFEQLVQLTGADMANIDDSVAMRDVAYTLPTDLGTGSLTADVDLDEEPLT
jgi:hypothetical protein